MLLGNALVLWDGVSR
ncbi:Protein of unknown function [Bacillus mycoides]|nr:Protein of unknown function [Bacillus mycoides]